MSGKSIAIIGAGISGLVACKEALANDLTPTIFERDDGIGGLWRKGLWRNFKTDIVKFNCAFSCKRWADAVATFPKKDQMLQYIQEFAHENGLEKYIQFNTTVKQCTQNGDGTWTIKVLQGADGKIYKFDFLIVANGFNALPKTPKIPGLETFTGTQFHSARYNYIDHLETNYTKALVVGGNFSATEIANDIAENSKLEVIQLVQSLNRHLKSLSSVQSSIYMSPMDMMHFSAFTKDMDSATEKGDKTDYARKMADSVLTYEQSSEFMTIKHSKESVYRSLNREYMEKTRNGRIEVINDRINMISGPNVHMDSGRVVTPDLIIFATGYVTDLPFFSEGDKKKMMYCQSDPNTPLILFYNIYCPAIPNLGFIGFSKGIFFPLIELQSKYLARIFSGKDSFPSAEAMTAFVNKERDIRHLRARLPILPLENLIQTIDFASLAEANPLTEDLKKDFPLVYESLMNRPFNACMFNFSGRDARPLMAYEVYNQMLKDYNDKLTPAEEAEFLAWMASIDRNFDLFRHFFAGEFSFERVIQDFHKKTSEVVTGEAKFEEVSLLEKRLKDPSMKKGELKEYLGCLGVHFDSKSDLIMIHAKDLRFDLDFRKNHLYSGSSIEDEDGFSHFEVSVNSLSKFTICFQMKSEQADLRVTTKYKKKKDDK